MGVQDAPGEFILSMKGRLSEHPLAELIREISGAGLSGVLRLVRARAKALVYFDEGGVVFAATNLRAHRLSYLLCRWGAVAPERVYAVAGEEVSDETLAAALVASDAINAAELMDLRARQSAEAVRTPLLWTDGEWRFEPHARLDSAKHAPLQIRHILLEAARRLPPEYVAVKLRGDIETVSPGGDVPVDLPLAPEEAYILSRLDAPFSLHDLTAVCGIPEVETKRAVYTLFLCGLVRLEGRASALSNEAVAQALAKQSEAAKEAVGAAQQRPDALREEVVAQKEEADPLAGVETLFKQAAAPTHYAVLAVARSAGPDEIKRVYYSLAKRFHPDRFRRVADPELLARVESAFSRVAQAYEVLRDSKARASYDLKLERMSVPTANVPTDSAKAGHAAPRAGDATQPRATTAGADARARAEVKFKQGVTAFERRDLETAAQHFAEAAQLMPEEARYRAHFGLALAQNRRTRRRAEAELQAAISLDANNADYHVMLAALYHDIGLRQRALDEVRHALKLSPSHAAACQLLRTIT